MAASWTMLVTRSTVPCGPECAGINAQAIVRWFRQDLCTIDRPPDSAYLAKVRPIPMAALPCRWCPATGRTSCPRWVVHRGFFLRVPSVRGGDRSLAQDDVAVEARFARLHDGKSGARASIEGVAF